MPPGINSQLYWRFCLILKRVTFTLYIRPELHSLLYPITLIYGVVSVGLSSYQVMVIELWAGSVAPIAGHDNFPA